MASLTSEIASSSSLPKWEYDVFLSFRGEDTRNNFTDHLYAALDQKGIRTFRDDERLERGKSISTELLNAIEKSKFAIIVLSRNYASSSWCLDELVKIVECKEETKLTVLPVFYGVDPSDVRKQTSFAEAFAKHEDLIKNEEKLQSWRAALTQVANLSGWDARNKQESTIIKEIVREILGDLNSSYSYVHKDLVGIKSRVKEMEDLCLGMGLNDVRFIGIWGMGGVGKTTLARVLYDKIHSHFDGSSFLANVREKSGNGGLVALQKQLLSDVLFESNINILDAQQGINVIMNRLCCKRVLVILDDVDQLEQLEALVGKRSWFGQGSVIIMTTRDQHLLLRHEVTEKEIYKARLLNDDEALKLFSLKAFKQDYPSEGYELPSQKVIYYAQGLPLALEILGSFLVRRNLDAWESLLGRLQECPESKILDVLQISFDGLRRTEKKIFLDIACFFKGMTKDRVANILRTPHSRPDVDIDVLMEKSLITISNGTLWMHDLLQELGKEIVRCESPDEPGGRSRLWLKEDILHVLIDNAGTEKVEGIFLNSSPNKEDNVKVNFEAFSKMRNLRLLNIGNVHLPQGLSFLSSELRLMNWLGYPLKFMPTNFHPNKLVQLIMPHSHIKQLWEGVWSLEWLRIIDLSDSRELIMTLDFARVPNLEKLILRGCTKLSMIHASLGDLKHLILLDLNGCKCLKSLPCKISWESLEIFILSGCSKLKKFPEIVGNMSRLLELYLDETAIEDLPLSMEQLTGLIKLVLTNCKNLSSLPGAICSLTSLKTLTLCGCLKLDNMPMNLGNLEGLEELDVSGTAIREPPSSICCLKNLKILSFQGCNGLSSKSWSWKKPLNFLLMTKTPDLTGLVLPSVSGLSSLTELNIRNCNLQAIPSDIGCLSSLEKLDLSGNNFVFIPQSINQLSNLREFWVANCKSLQLLPELRSRNYIEVWANGCTSLESLLPFKKKNDHPNFYLYLLDCFQLVENQGRCDLFTTMLREYFQESTIKERKRFDVFIPGSEVPNWFRHQSVGASINLELPSYLFKQFRGIALCAVFRPHLHHPPSNLIYSLACHIKANGNWFSGTPCVRFLKEFYTVESDHRWFMYLLPNYFQHFLRKEFLQIADGSSCQLEIEFLSWDPRTEIKKCGAHMV
ncbi:disease resistance protein RUN1-like [Quercus robur]|uniref:disease resistance protein RUN1-like n=1 Tax=Quercus robur TaxID=38942 RepID=UPI002161AAB3|nr:disease resistance protein RUN1-like [Quercus robur]XP_050286582.1 disease resistance protein RUN1-like [Quercus robur]XP_050286584.1 disease resistance protein RUN1-like [Quercus robur]XP_050286585.1 disease resistance protein RUN1-like [Quercus robur]XP_050286586.1 disease resistance protein RUN1-like [Quercus robur]XP_050286587.1 disease resistance protein RUN1-like [Quercus robur]XP_050286588.1 disease resistance protein RUN1-like [Quercus robur]XP_050286589.1 disease resistance prote